MGSFTHGFELIHAPPKHLGAGITVTLTRFETAELGGEQYS